VKVAIVVQRYGADINGGAEQHARYVAEHLATHVEVEVLTTCAHRDYISWKNELPAGKEMVHGIAVHRFPVAVERNPVEFAKWSTKVFTEQHSLRDELAWLEAEGPTSPALIDYIKQHEADYDYFIFFSFRYHHSFHGCRAVPGKAILVPTAERDGALGVANRAEDLVGSKKILLQEGLQQDAAHLARAEDRHAKVGKLRRYCCGLNGYLRHDVPCFQ